MLLFMTLLGFAQISENTLAKRVEQILERPQLQDGVWGVYVYAPYRDKVLFARNERRNFRPASNMKIMTSLLALDHLGPDYCFYTSIYRSGPIRNGVLEGDLWVEGHGDPSLSGHYLGEGLTTEDLMDALVIRLKQEGIQEIEGNIHLVQGFFDDEVIAKSWEWDDIGEYYGTPVTDLVANEGWFEVQIDVDEDMNITTKYEPESTSGVEIDCHFDPDQDPEDPTYRRKFGTNHFDFFLAPTPCTQFKSSFSAWDPARQFGEILVNRLEANGIDVRGVLKLDRDVSMESNSFLFNFFSPPLSDLAKVLMKVSQNHYADTFLKTVGRQYSGIGSFEAGRTEAEELLQKAVNEFSRIPDIDGFHMVDGSGLSSQNYVQPQQICALLYYGFNQPFKKEWLAAFPVMGVDGTLSRRGSDVTNTQGNVLAKTGYIYRSRCLSGFVETPFGEPILFSMLVNSYGCKTSLINRVQDEICSTLLQLKPSRKARKSIRTLGPANLLGEK